MGRQCDRVLCGPGHLIKDRIAGKDNLGLNLDLRPFWPEQELCAISASVGVNAHNLAPVGG